MIGKGVAAGGRRLSDSVARTTAGLTARALSTAGLGTLAALNDAVFATPATTVRGAAPPPPELRGVAAGGGMVRPSLG